MNSLGKYLHSIPSMLGRCLLQMVVCSTFCVTFFQIVVVALPLLIAILDLWLHGADTRSDYCSDGNNGMYRLGVRIAAYIQVLLVLMAELKPSCPEIARSVNTANIWFSILLTTALINMLWDSHTTILDLYIVVLLGNGLTTLMFRPIRSLSSKINYTHHETRLTQVSKMLIVGAWKACTTIFWWREIRLQGLSQAKCEYYGFFVRRMILANGSGLHTTHKYLNIMGWAAWFWVFFTPNLFTIILIFRAVFGWTLPGNTPRNPLPIILNGTNIPSRFRILLDCLVTFPTGDLHRLIYWVCICITRLYLIGIANTVYSYNS